MNSNFSVESILNNDRKLSSSNTTDSNFLTKSSNNISANLSCAQNFEPNNNILSNYNFNSHHPLDSLPNLNNANLFNISTDSGIKFNSNPDLNQFSPNRLIQHENFNDFNQNPFKKLRKSDDLNFINQFNESNNHNIHHPALFNPINHNLNILPFENSQQTIRNNTFPLNLDNAMPSFYLPNMPSTIQSTSNNRIQNTLSSFKSSESNSSNSNQNTQIKNKDKSSCSRCKLHGQYSELKNHKNNCPFMNCSCDVCRLYKNTNKLRRKNADNLFNNSSLNDQSSIGLINQSNSNNNLNNNFNLPNFFNFEFNKSPSTFNYVENASTNLINQHQRNVSPTNSESNKSASAIEPSNSDNEKDKLDCFNNSIIENNSKQVIEILKEKLIKDGLNFEEELPKLKFAVIGMLMQKFKDKNELFHKLSNQ